MNQNIIDRNKGILSGTPIFKGTRVPIKSLFDYLECGDSINDFLNDFPTVTKDQVIGLLEYFKDMSEAA